MGFVVKAAWVSLVVMGGAAVVMALWGVGMADADRQSGMKCFVDNCEFQKAPLLPMDTEAESVFYESLPACQAARPGVLELKAPVTVWTGDKGPDAAVRARFTPQRDTPPYFLLWLPGGVAAVVLLASVLLRMRDWRRAKP